MKKQVIREFAAEAKAWRCECGAICNPASAEWRWNGQQWEHSHGYPLGHVTATRTVKRVAHDTGDGWWIGEENAEGDVINEEGIEWPADWPEEVSTSFLREKGYEIV